MIGPYRLGAPLGIGGDARVHAAWRSDLGEPVALKVLRPDRAGDPGARGALVHEAEVLAAVRHPHVVRLIDADPSHPFLAMVVLPGGSAQSHLRRRGPLPARSVADLLAGVADALAWLHGNRVVHGDVKPGNLLLDAGGIATLIDFGRAAVDGRCPIGRAATPGYASPDILVGLPPDPRDDVFSLGAVAYELLAGLRPFADDPVPGLGAPDRPAGLDTAAWRWLRAALAPARRDRPADPREMIAVLHRAATGAAVPCPA